MKRTHRFSEILTFVTRLRGNFRSQSLSNLPSATILLLEQKGSTSHAIYCFVGGEFFFKAEPPAGPPKFDLLVADATFPEISIIFGIMPETVLPKEIRSDNKINTTSASLDSFYFNEARKIAPK